jgi:5-formyltetrahydrofolate cyclo-ligase
MDMVKITSIEDFESLPMNKWNIPEPPLNQARENGMTFIIIKKKNLIFFFLVIPALDEDGNGLDLILVPGVAFDQNRNRIGHGKG